MDGIAETTLRSQASRKLRCAGLHAVCGKLGASSPVHPRRFLLSALWTSVIRTKCVLLCFGSSASKAVSRMDVQECSVGEQEQVCVSTALLTAAVPKRSGRWSLGDEPRYGSV
jgi:hypothetical protein